MHFKSGEKEYNKYMIIKLMIYKIEEEEKSSKWNNNFNYYKHNKDNYNNIILCSNKQSIKHYNWLK